MNLIVDTSVWSLVLRRKQVDENNPYVLAFRKNVESGHCIHLVGNVLQELLDGVKKKRDFDRLISLLEPFPLVETTRKTWIFAAELRNRCRAKGLQASPVDFLITAACIENSYPLLTSDGDFLLISRHCDLIIQSVQETISSG